MDSKLFRLPTKPNFYAGISSADPFNADQRQKRSQLPTPDNRYPGWAGPMEDGRLVTDYQNHCSKNVPTGKQYATKEWMTKNSLEIVRLSRERFSHTTGAYLGLDPGVVPPPASVTTCSRSDCIRSPTEEPGGIGVERGDSETPELFGTWDPRQMSLFPKSEGAKLTTVYEGGRNTPRGGFST